MYSAQFEKWFSPLDVFARTNLGMNRWDFQCFGVLFISFLFFSLSSLLLVGQSRMRTSSERFRFQVAKYLGQGILFIAQIVIMFMCIQ